MLDSFVESLGDLPYVGASEEEGFASEVYCRTLPEGLGVALELLRGTEPLLTGGDDHLERRIRRLQSVRRVSFAIAWLSADGEQPHLRHSTNLLPLDAGRLLLRALEEEICLIRETM